MKTLYEILGVSETATSEEIKKAYRKLAKEHHPDTNSDWSEEEKKMHVEFFSEITDAYEILINEETRKDYDEKLKEKRSKRSRTSKNNSNYYEEDYDYEDDYSYEYDYFSKKRERFNKRFKDVNKEILKKYLRKHKREPQTFPEYATYFLSFGAIHISKEFLYQLSKLKKKDDDTPKKYVIRNRYNFTAFALAIILANGMIGNKNTISAQESTYETSTQSTKSDTEQEKTDNETKNMNKRKNEVQTKILLTRKYVIKPGDYLSKIAEDAGISIYELQTINNIRSADLIKIGDTIIVPYNIESENKEFYTKKIVLFDRDLSKIAAEYETDFDTLYRLNEEAIEKVTDNTYVVLSDTIEVPNFITTTELNSMKEKTKNY